MNVERAGRGPSLGAATKNCICVFLTSVKDKPFSLRTTTPHPPNPPPRAPLRDDALDPVDARVARHAPRPRVRLLPRGDAPVAVHVAARRRRVRRVGGRRAARDARPGRVAASTPAAAGASGRRPRRGAFATAATVPPPLAAAAAARAAIPPRAAAARHRRACADTTGSTNSASSLRAIPYKKSSPVN